MRIIRVIVLLVIVFHLFIACNEGGRNNTSQQQQKPLKESLEKVNRYLVNDEEEDIRNYMTRHQLDMISTGTGLRYQVLKAGEGDSIRPGQLVSLEYVLKNIMGDVIYSSDNDGIKSFVVGHGDVESGLDEAVRLFKKGTVAQLIIPSHLGYGLLGDQKDIPERATLIYTIKIIDVK